MTIAVKENFELMMKFVFTINIGGNGILDLV
jgi:hypothetical protein